MTGEEFFCGSLQITSQCIISQSVIEELGSPSLKLRRIKRDCLQRSRWWGRRHSNTGILRSG